VARVLEDCRDSDKGRIVSPDHARLCGTAQHSRRGADPEPHIRRLSESVSAGPHCSTVLVEKEWPLKQWPLIVASKIMIPLNWVGR
jgi:hypothetical protein